MMGTWSGSVSTSAFGPLTSETLKGGDKNFLVISTPDAAGNIYMRHDAISQLFRIQNGLVQYCFNYDAPNGGDEAPFQVVQSDSANEINFCWRGPRLPTHQENCTACECAKWTLRLNGNTLHSTFMMSPPAMHLSMDLVRDGSAPSPESVSRGWNCQFNNHTGPPLNTSSVHRKRGLGVCAGKVAKGRNALTASDAIDKDSDGADNLRYCAGFNDQHRVVMQYTASNLPCMPCDVAFTFSADTPVDSSSIDYIAVGFKGRYGAYMESSRVAPDMPDYWGMSTGTLAPFSGDIGPWGQLNETGLSGRILAAYASQGNTTCVREMRADAYVGSVIDTPSDGVVQNATAYERGGRTTLRFTVSMYAGTDKADLSWRGFGGRMGRLEVMWAIGKVGNDGDCNAPLQYHSFARGLAGLGFPGSRFECPPVIPPVGQASTVPISVARCSVPIFPSWFKLALVPLGLFCVAARYRLL
jgi:hypothetical protein